MNILQILPELNFGGVETGTVDFSKKLVSLGHKCIIVSAGGKQKEHLIKAGVVHYELPVHKKSPFSILYAIKKLKGIIREEKIDIVHARSRVPAIIGAVASYLTEVPFITTCHGYYSRHFFSKVMGWGKFVIVISNSIGRHMVDDFHLPLERIRLIWRGVDGEQFYFKEPSILRKGPYVIGMIGRLTPIKGHKFFVKSLFAVLTVIPNLKILIVGEAPEDKLTYKEEIKKLISKMRLEKKVEFLGETKDIPAVMSRLDLLVLATTAQEAFGRVIIEAFASGVPVVATSVGGVLDIINDRTNGLLVPPADPKAMAQAIIDVLKNNDLRISLIKEAKKTVDTKFGLDTMVKKTLKVYEETLSVKRILVIKLSSIGDVILAVPSLRALRQHFPRAKICVLVGIKSRQIIQNCPYIDEVIVLEDSGKSIVQLFQKGKELFSYRFDITVDLQNNKISHLLSLLSWAPSRYGFDNGKLSFLLNHRVRFIGLGAIDPVAHQSKVLGIMGVRIEDDSLELWPDESDCKHIDEMLSVDWVSKKQPLVGMNISTSSKWQTKRWPLENFVRLSDMLAKENVRTVLTGSREDISLAKKFISFSKIKPINFVGKTSLLELAALIKRCGLFITGDSAPMHVAAAMNIPFIALFGPTDPARHISPAKDFFLVKKDFKCMPCYKSHCFNPKCMTMITPEEIFDIARKNLTQNK
ncbi:MAG: GT4 family glycosyltransferase PelF [Candidatus Omnitrophota bacterium]